MLQQQVKQLTQHLENHTSQGVYYAYLCYAELKIDQVGNWEIRTGLMSKKLVQQGTGDISAKELIKILNSYWGKY